MNRRGFLSLGIAGLAEIVQLFSVRALALNRLDAEHAFGLGQRNQLSADHGMALGQDGHVEHVGGLAFADVFISGIGDVQSLSLLLRGVTVGAVSAVLKLSDNSLPVVPQLSTWAFSSRLVARRTDATAKGAAYVHHGGIRRDAAVGTVAIMGAVVNPLAVDEFGGAVAITADTTNGALQVQVTGVVGYSLNWVARVDITQTKTIL